MSHKTILLEFSVQLIFLTHVTKIEHYLWHNCRKSNQFWICCFLYLNLLFLDTTIFPVSAQCWCSYEIWTELFSYIITEKKYIPDDKWYDIRVNVGPGFVSPFTAGVLCKHLHSLIYSWEQYSYIYWLTLNKPTYFTRLCFPHLCYQYFIYF